MGILRLKSHVLRKSWTDDEIQELTKTPSLLMINVDFVVEGDSDVFAAAHRIWNRVNPEDAVKVFELKPGVFGFSIDLIQAGRFLRELYMHLVYRGGSA